MDEERTEASIGPCSWRGSAGLLTRRGGGLAAAGAGSARGGTGGRGLLSFLCTQTVIGGRAMIASDREGKVSEALSC